MWYQHATFQKRGSYLTYSPLRKYIIKPLIVKAVAWTTTHTMYKTIPLISSKNYFFTRQIVSICESPFQSLSKMTFIIDTPDGHYWGKLFHKNCNNHIGVYSLHFYKKYKLRDVKIWSILLVPSLYLQLAWSYCMNKHIFFCELAALGWFLEDTGSGVKRGEILSPPQKIVDLKKSRVIGNN